MSNIPITAGNRALHAQRLVANTEDVVTFADDVDRVEVICDGTADVFVTVDGTTATVNGANTYRFPAGIVATREFAIPITNVAGATAIHLKSAGTPVYSITRL